MTLYMCVCVCVCADGLEYMDILAMCIRYQEHLRDTAVVVSIEQVGHLLPWSLSLSVLRLYTESSG